LQNQTVTNRIGFIGGGNMATSLISGIAAQGDASLKNLWVFEPNAEKAKTLALEFGINRAKDNAELIANSDIVVIAVKPQVLQQVLTPCVNDFKQQQPLIISIVAGIAAASIEKWLEGDYSIVRVMPNTPALIGMGACGLFANQKVDQQQRDAAAKLCNSVGISAWVNSEADIDSVTALSGSGPAYFMLFIQGLIEAAVAAGLSADTARALAVQTAAGAAQLISASNDTPLQTLINNVTSPNGTTEKALQSFANANLKHVIADAFDAARTRSDELAKELG
jgi:pyrroline-5-carboxylate reductase